MAERGDRTRHAVLLTPASRTARALAVELHGSGLDIARQRSLSGLANILLAADVAVLLPQGALPFRLTPVSQSGYAWNVPGAPLPGGSVLPTIRVDDVGWIDGLIETVRSELEMTTEPLFLTGYSGGARLASHLLIGGRSPWSAAGLVAGLRPVDGGDRPPPPTIAFHGLDDVVNPFAGGDGSRWALGVDEACRRYADLQGCRSGFTEAAVRSASIRIYGTGTIAMLTVYRLARAGHAWPGSVDAAHLHSFGPASQSVHASDLISRFFGTHMAH